MKLIRYEGENVTPSDDAILYRAFLSDGLFATVTPTFTSGAITIPAMRGVICGRDFTTDTEELTAVLASTGTITGQIYMWIDMEDETYPLSIKIRNSVGSLSDDDINNGGQYYGLEIAQYTANTSAVTGITLTVGLVEFNGLADKAPLASPAFTGTPTINAYNLKSLKNAIINGGFQVNQRAVTGSVVLSAGVYGHDRWKAGASGCSYTFATVENVTTLTISAGSLIQVVEGLNLETDTYCLSWEGTAQGKIGVGSYGNSGVTGLVTGGTNINIEFGTGTLSKVRLNKGLVAIEWHNQPYADVLRECQRYYVRFNAPNSYSRYGMGDSATANIANIIINFPNTMITVPTSIDYSGAFAIQTTGVTSSVSSVGLSIPASSKNIGFLDCNTSGLTAGRVALLISHDNTTSYIGFNAEL